MALHYYSSTAAVSALASGISNSATSMTVTTVSGFPASFPYYLSIDRGNSSIEIVEVTAAAGTVLTITRGIDSTPAVAHSAGAVVEHVAPGLHYQDGEAHVEASTAVHGITGAVVGTTDSQTLTNKTVSVDDNTVGGVAASSFVLSDGSGNIDGAAAQKVIPAGAVVGTTDAQTLTNKTISGASNTLSDIAQASVTNLTTDLANKQPLDSDLTALAANATNGLWARTGAGTGSARTLVSASSPSLLVTNGDGVTGNPAVSLTTVLSSIGGTAGEGFIARTSAGGANIRTLTTPNSTLSIGNGNGSAGNPTLDIADTGWVTTGFTAQTGFTNNGSRYRILGGILVILQCEVDRSGANISFPAGGNLGDTFYVDLPPAINPARTTAFNWVAASRSNGGGFINTSGNCTLSSGNGGGAINTGDTIRFMLTYFLD